MLTRKCRQCKATFLPVCPAQRFCHRKCETVHLEARPKLKPSKDIWAGKMPSSTVGAIKELRVCCDPLERGVHVFRSKSPSCPCDLIGMWDGGLTRIEVTSGSIKKNGALYWSPHDKEKFDVIAVVMPDFQIIYMPDIFPKRDQFNSIGLECPRIDDDTQDVESI